MHKETLAMAFAIAASVVAPIRPQSPETSLDWKTIASGRSAEVPSASRPARAVPSDLRAAAGSSSPPAPSQPADEEIGRKAHAAAKQTASELLELEGRPEAYRVGIYDGLHTALDDPGLGRWEFQRGLENGRRSPDARLRGSGIGASAAEETADRVAYENVSAQFHDLSVEPLPRQYAEVPPFGVTIRESSPPSLDEIFRNQPLDRFFSRRSSEPADAWQIYRHRSRRDLFLPHWRNAQQAYEHWLQSHPADRQPYFKDMFLFTYPRALATISRVVDEAYLRGFDDGWDCGAFVHARQSYLGGYYQGWYESLRRSAEETYRQGFERTYAARYSQYFHEWSTSPRPEILAVEMRDANDDGVFEPGETLYVEHELANYGGATGEFVVRLESQVLSRGASEPVELPRRAIRRSAAPVEVEIDPGVRPRTESSLDVSVAGLEQHLPLKVSYPLELERRIRLLEHDAAEGRAVVEAVVHNMSRRAVAGEIGLSGEAAPAPEPFAEIAAGGDRRFSFTLAGLSPLDLLSGIVEVKLFVASGGKVYDEHAERLPELAVDLEDRELLRYMLHLARGGAPSPDEMRGAQELMLRRLRVDWTAAAAASGNPYKKDLQEGTRETALGDLVQTYSTERHTFSHPEVFTALAPRIEALAKSLPGAHPFLRRSVKKLARPLAGGGARSAATPVSAENSEPLAEGSGVKLFEHTHFRGRSESFAVSSAGLRGHLIGNDQASSIKVAPGCTAVLYEHDGYRGRSTAVGEDIEDLGRTAVGNDALSSLEVRCSYLNG